MNKDFRAWLKAIGKAKAAAVQAEITELDHANPRFIKSHEDWENAANIVIDAFTRQMRKSA